MTKQLSSSERHIQNVFGGQVSRGTTASCRTPAQSRLFEAVTRIGTMTGSLLGVLKSTEESLMHSGESQGALTKL